MPDSKLKLLTNTATLTDDALLYAVNDLGGTPVDRNITALDLANVIADKLSLDTTFAPIGEGVTNGNSHSHSTGDGGQISYDNLSDTPTLGTAAAQDVEYFATAAQGSTADTALQPGDIIPASDISFENDGVGTHVNTIAEFYNHAWSSTSVSGFDLTNNNDGTITIASGEVVIRNSASEDATLKSWSVGQTSNILLTDNSVNYIVVNYNSGTPNITAVTSTSDYNCLDKCLIYKCVRYGTVIKWIDGRGMGVDSSRKHRRILMLTQGYRRAYGGMLSAVGTRQLSVTAGKFFWALSEDIDTPDIDTSVAGVFTTVYRNGSGGFTRVLNQTQINNTQYDDGTGTLVTVDNNKYIVHWLYLCFDTPTTLYSVYGTAQYATLADAKASTVPAVLPPEIVNLGELIGRVIIQKSASSFAALESAYTASFIASTPTSHNTLAGLQGGTANDYQHLTTAELAVAQSVSTQRSDTNAISGWVNRTPTLTISASSGEFTVTITGSIVVWIKGTRHTKTNDSVTVSGLSANAKYYIYYNDTGTLVADTGAGWSITGGTCLTATVYYQHSPNFAVVYEERHTAGRDLNWHNWAHDTVGARLEGANSFAITSLTTSAISLQSGIYYDEDIELSIGSQTTCRMIYRAVGGTSAVFETTPATKAIKVDTSGTPLIYWDNNGTLTTHTGATAKWYNYYIYAVNAKAVSSGSNTPIYCIMGQAVYTSLALAQAASEPVITSDVPSAELKLLYVAHYTQSNGAVSLAATSDKRFTSTVSGGGSGLAITAAGTSFAPAGTLTSTNVQAAIEEVQAGENITIDSTGFTGHAVGVSTVQGLAVVVDELVTGGTSLTITGTAGENISAGDVVNVKVADGKVWKVDNDTEALVAGLIGVATETKNSTETITVQYGGAYTVATTAGATYYIGDTAGSKTTTQPSTSGKFVRSIGYGSPDGTKLIVMPEDSYYELGSITTGNTSIDGITTTGSGGAYVLTPSPAIATYSGARLFVKLHETPSTAASTINISGLGAISFKYYGTDGVKYPITPQSSSINWASDCFYDGTDWVMLFPMNRLALTNRKGIFGYGYVSAASSLTNVVSNVGVVATDTTGVGTARSALGSCGYGLDKGIFGYGYTGSVNTAITNLVSNTGVVATDTTGVGSIRSGLAACSYGLDKGIFGYGDNGSKVSMTNLVSNTGVVATDTTGVGTGRRDLTACSYGLDKGIFGYGFTTVKVSMTNLVSNTGIVASDTTGVGSERYTLASCVYGLDKCIFGYGYTGSSWVSMTNLVSNTGVVATDTTGVGTARNALAACSYGLDKGIFGYGYNSTPINVSLSNLVSNTGVVATDTTGVGTARRDLAASGFGG